MLLSDAWESRAVAARLVEGHKLITDDLIVW